MHSLPNVSLAFLILLVASPAFAVPPGTTIEYKNNAYGPVQFSGDVHAAKKLDCQSCHPKIFQQKQTVLKASLADHQQGKTFCFACHNGKAAFNAMGNCERCHRKNK